MDVRGRLDAEALLTVILVLVVALLVLELVDAVVGLLPVFSRSPIALLIIVLILLWYVRQR
ncbi:hypothetical protein [Halalkalicoccus sp. NIPERK01]|uniref:DUF7554 family protein n=1 Tax=Halalkalicoccus sp. NIPERK01 TaxID=3053469 RepID=UPI00256EDFEB|nr:hypothetical protein [Halalkalicoccus sp. NIPERK01]MDL5362859.1 hypothetical protein [Halalkalicoccus sp. NIPERK01]